MNVPKNDAEELLDRADNVGGLIFGVSENRAWIELFYEGDTMHTKTVALPEGALFDIFVEDIPHKATVYEYPCTTIYFEGPCDLEICRDGDKVIVRGSGRRKSKKSEVKI